MTIYLRRFATVGTLKAIEQKHLVALLEPYRSYLTGRGLKLPPAGAAGILDHDRLVDVLMSPQPDAPRSLLDALYRIDEMSTPEGAQELLQEADLRELRIEGDPDPSAADVAVQVYLQAPDLLERKHAEHLLTSRRSFDYFQSITKRRALKPPSASKLSALAEALDDWYERKKRGRVSRVLVFPKEDGIWFLVRHADTLNRAGAIEAGQSSSVVYRPEKHDVLVYDMGMGELRMNTCNAGERELFRREFGRHLFGSADFFPGASKYTLEPLRESGAASLVCTDVEGVDWVRLTEVRLFWGGPHKHVEIQQASDVFAMLDARKRELPKKARISQARFRVKFSDAKAPRSVTIRPSNIAQYTRDSDASVLEAWLLKRGFISSEPAHDDE